MRVAKIIVKGKEHIVELKKVEPVLFAPGVWALVEDLDRAWHNKELRWVPTADTVFMWIRDFS
jgi:hypothetical protein